jgi:outer membrane lipoprotein-sorting protein
VFDMTRLLLAATTLALGVAPLATADDDHAKAKAVVEKAIKAAGWDKAAPAMTTWKDNGKFTGGGMSADFTGTWAFAAPDKYRFTVNMVFGDQKVELTVVANGDKVWESAFGMSRMAEGEKREYVKEQVYRLWVQSLVPLVSDKEFTLKPLPEIKIDAAPAVGVEVTRKGKPAVKLYFDAKTGLLAKTEMMVKNEFDGWKETLSEGSVGGWKDGDGGRKVFTKLTVAVSGKTMLESDLSDTKAHDKLDAKLFEIPEVKK